MMQVMWWKRDFWKPIFPSSFFGPQLHPFLKTISLDNDERKKDYYAIRGLKGKQWEQTGKCWFLWLCMNIGWLSFLLSLLGQAASKIIKSSQVWDKKKHVNSDSLILAIWSTAKSCSGHPRFICENPSARCVKKDSNYSDLLFNLVPNASSFCVNCVW